MSAESQHFESADQREQPHDAHQRRATGGRHHAAHADDDATDPYATLGVTPQASADELHAAYRRMALRWHPDHFADASPEEREQAERRMRSINQAYQLLSDPIARRLHDQKNSAIQYGGESKTVHINHEHTPLHVTYAVQHERPVTQTAARESYEARHIYNPNGAGQGFAICFIVLSVGIAGHLALHSAESLFWTTISVVALGITLTLAALFSAPDSWLARAATDFIERNPPTETATRQTRRSHHAGRHTRHQHAPQHSPQRSPHHQPSPQHPHEPAERHTSDDAANRATDTTDADEADAGLIWFEELVQEALASVPEQFAPYMSNVVVRVREQPDEQTLKRAHIHEGAILLGLYEGAPLTKQGAHGAAQPEVISIYRRTIERYCGGDPERIRAQVRATTLHELAHHFGIDHDEMPNWVK